MFAKVWIDEEGIKSPDDLDGALKSEKALTRLEELANAEGLYAATKFEDGVIAIAAGRGLDLSGDLDCWHVDCQRQQLEKLFRGILHYFDKVIVAGPQAHAYVDGLRERNEHFVDTVIASQMRMLLVIKELGLDGFVDFVQKDPSCVLHYGEHARSAGVSNLLAGQKELVKEVSRAGHLRKLKPHKGHWDYTFDCNFTEHTTWGSVTAQKQPRKRDVANDVFIKYMAGLTSDVITARRLGVPLGVRIPMHRLILERGGGQSTTENVIFDMRLPILEGIPIPDLVALREEQASSFESFRVALAAAVSERMTVDTDVDGITDRIMKEVISPALNDIDRQLEVVRSGLVRRTASKAVQTGVLATSVGLLSGSPTRAVIVGGAGATASAAKSVLENKANKMQAVTLSDMYFLWTAQRAHGG